MIRRPFAPAPYVAVVRVMLSAAFAVALAGPAAAEWPPELRSALGEYRAGDFAETEEIVRFVARNADTDRLRAEANALHALVQLRADDRQTVTAAGTIIKQLSSKIPDLLDRPETNLALGIGYLSLNESAAALQSLNRARAGFEAGEQRDRLGETLVTLAAAWLQHGEWEFGTPGYAAEIPLDPRGRELLRRRQAAELRDRAAELPRGEQFAQEVDLLRIQHMLAYAVANPAYADEDVAAAEALLRDLASQTPLTPPVAEAKLLRAERLAEAGAYTPALDLYRSVADADFGPLSQAASAAVAEILTPRCTLAPPTNLAAGERFDLAVRARNLTDVTIEFRRVALVDWLNERQGVFEPSQLPITGAVQLVRSAKLAPAAAHAPVEITLAELELPRGAFVAFIRGATSAGASFESRELFIVAPQPLQILIRGYDALAFAPPGGEHPITELRFWMFGSFRARPIKLDNGAALFPVPPEARVLRERRFIAVALDAAGRVRAAVRGEVPDAARLKQPVPEVALLGGPTQLAPGEPLSVFGILLGRFADQPLALEVVSGLGETYASATVTASAGGTFLATLPAPQEEIPALRVRVRQAGRVLPQLSPPLSFDVVAASSYDYAVKLTAPEQLAASRAGVIAEVAASYPWRSSGGAAPAVFGARAANLPLAGELGAPQLGRISSRYQSLDADGTRTYVIALEDLGRPPGPLAIRVFANVVGPDHRSGSVADTLYAAGAGPTLWTLPSTPTGTIGYPVWFHVGWFRDGVRAPFATPALEIESPGGVVSAVPLVPIRAGADSLAWWPAEQGVHIVRARLPQVGGGFVTSEGEFEVTPAAAAPIATRAPRLRVLNQPAPGAPLALRVAGALDEPLLLWTQNADRILAARVLPADAADTRFVQLPPPTDEVTPTYVFAARVVDGLLLLLDAVPIDVRPQAKLTILEFPNEPAAGRTARAVLSYDTSAAADSERGAETRNGAHILVRLIRDDAWAGYLWAPPTGATRSPLLALPTFAFNAAATAALDPTRLPRPELLTAAAPAAVVWAAVGTADADGRVAFDVPLPVPPGAYRLEALACDPAGRVVSAQTTFDLRLPVHAEIALLPHLTLGDRTRGLLTLRNDASAALEIEASLTLGAGLALEQLPEALLAVDSESAAALSITLAPDETRAIPFAFEAAAVGAGNARLELGAGGQTRRVVAERAYHVHAPAVPTADDAQDSAVLPAVEIDRLLFITDVPEIAQPVPESAGEFPARAAPFEGDFAREPLDPGVRVPLGRYILVREEIRLAEPLRATTWTQRMPGHCLTFAVNATSLRRVGIRAEVAPARVVWEHLDALDRPGVLVHEYLLVPAQVGACRLPPPRIESGEKILLVRLTGFTEPIIIVSPR